jgi:protein-L-isoaspartate(D-aspartate) O-methyltransferase
VRRHPRCSIGGSASTNEIPVVRNAINNLCSQGAFLIFASIFCTNQRHFTMAWRSSGNTNNELVDNLFSHGVFKSKRAIEAMKAVDRGNYCIDRRNAYVDAPQSIGHSATISAPHMHAMCLDLLEGQLKEGAKVLDVGSGSGYLTACFAQMIGNGGHAYGVEHIPDLVKFARSNIQKGNPELANRVDFLESDGRHGLPDYAPYDAIHVGAAAEQIPRSLLEQLKIGGRMIIPVGPQYGMQVLVQVDRTDEAHFSQKPITGVGYVPLTGRS